MLDIPIDLLDKIIHMARNRSLVILHALSVLICRTDKYPYALLPQCLIGHIAHNADLIDLGDYSADWTEEQKQQFSDACTVKGLEAYYECIDDYPAADSYVSDEFAITAQKTDEAGAVQDTYLLYKRYQAGLMDLDVGVNRLIHELEVSGELSDTTFVFYADHNAYYTQQSYYMKGIDTDEYWNTAHYNIPFFIWSGSCMNLTVNSSLYDGMIYTNDDEKVQSAIVYDGEYYYDVSHRASENIGGVRIEKYCNSFDILPTILDLLGYDYNMNLYHGVSVFKQDVSIFVSREAGMFTDNIYSDGDKVFVKCTQDGGVTVSDVGQVRFEGENVTITIGGEDVTFSAAEVDDLVYLSDAGDYVIFDLDAIFRKDGGESEYLSDGVTAFLRRTSAYYQKQDMLEQMYEYDYFADRDIGDFVKKLS